MNSDNLGLRYIRRALISVTDKTGIGQVGAALVRRNVELVSTGGTKKALADGGLAVRDVSDLTGFPEMMDGRLKTLHPKVHGGLLAIRNNQTHAEAMEKHGIGYIDLLIVNLYPFEKTVAKADVGLEHAVENIDIGGPAMIRGAAKNHDDVAVVTDPRQYARLLQEIDKYDGATTLSFRRKLMVEAYALTGRYDRAIADHFVGRFSQDYVRQAAE